MTPVLFAPAEAPPRAAASPAAPRASAAAGDGAGALRVAIVHYWLVGPGGGETVVAAIKAMFPQADIFTLVADPAFVRRLLGDVTVTVSFLQRIPFARSIYRRLLPLMPAALENFDLTGYDLVISSESGPAKGVLPPLGAVHICYCHSPMRYLWDHYHVYRAASPWFTRMVMGAMIAWLRLWDQGTSTRVDHFIANSHHVRSRIAQYYRRPAHVIPPPVDTGAFALAPPGEEGDYYLVTGRHVDYKRIDQAIAACERLGRPLIITGQGPETERLRKLAGAWTRFEGQVPFARLREHYARCRAFLMPGEEDFGIAPVEAMASGRPVIALGRGGALDTVIDGVSGVLYPEDSVDGLCAAILRFEALAAQFDPPAIRRYAETFDKALFETRMRAFVAEAMAVTASAPASALGSASASALASASSAAAAADTRGG